MASEFPSSSKIGWFRSQAGTCGIFYHTVQNDRRPPNSRVLVLLPTCYRGSPTLHLLLFSVMNKRRMPIQLCLLYLGLRAIQFNGTIMGQCLRSLRPREATWHFSPREQGGQNMQIASCESFKEDLSLGSQANESCNTCLTEVSGWAWDSGEQQFCNILVPVVQ